MKRYCLGLIIVTLFIALFAIPALSEGDNDKTAAAPAQDQVQAPAAPAAETVPAVATAPATLPDEEAPQSKELSIYGEVQSVDAASNSMSVQYYDYDSDEEKATDVMVNKDTRIENAATLADIKKGDWADVTYTVQDGKSIAKSIMVEKEEEPSTQVPPDSDTTGPSE